MTDNPYNAPQADLTPIDWELRRQRFRACARDRAGLWACGTFMFLPFTYLAYETHWLAAVAVNGLFAALIAAYELTAWVLSERFGIRVFSRSKDNHL